MQRHRLRVFAALGIAIPAVLGGVVFVPDWTGRTTPPEALRIAARESHREAVAAGAPRFAPVEFTAADTLLEAALREYRRQELRWFPFRDFRPLAPRLAVADSFAQRAAAISREGARDSATRVRERAAHASAGIALAEEFSRAILLPESERSRLAGAALALARSRGELEAGRPRRALEPAREADSLAAEVLRFATRRTRRFVDPGELERWRSLVKEAIALSRREGGPVLVVSKAERELTLYRGGVEELSIPFEGSPNGIDDKRHQGDLATPEGRYRVEARKGRGASRYHKALLLDYPNPEDEARYRADRAAGRIAAGVGVGGLIEIHGGGGRGRDWTDGCIAVRNEEMDLLFEAVTTGTPVFIVGSRDGGGPFGDLHRRVREWSGAPRESEP